MNKITDFYQHNKKALLGLLIAGATSALSVYLYKYFTTRSVQKSSKVVKETNAVQNVKPSGAKLALTKEQMLDIIAKIKRSCNEDLRFLRNNYRLERRKLFYDEEAYQQLLEDYDSKLLQILESTSEDVFKEYKITNATFDKLVKTYNDEEINIAVDSMATVEEECEAPSQITKELLLEIFNYNNKRCNASVLESNKNFEYLNTRIQDEIYFKYKIEVEELSACYKKFDCDHDPDFLPKIDEMQRSISAHYNS